MWRYSYNLRGLYETPSPNAAQFQPDREAAAGILNAARHDAQYPERTILSEYESKKLLQAYGIPCVTTEIAPDEDAAVEAAGRAGYPVVLKLHSLTITHKTDVGGVILNLANPGAVRHAFRQIRENVESHVGLGHFLGVTVQPYAKPDGYELILGSSLDPQFGPVLLFGTGGQLVEVFEDRSLALPPLNSTLARRMMEQTRIFRALRGVRGRKAIDLAALEELMVRFSDLVIENPAIKEIDINPLLASPDRLLALDARVVVHPAEVPDEKLPRSAIRPYPVRYVGEWTSKDGERLLIRPIRPEDEPLMIDFHKKLSERTVYLRYFQPLKLTQRTAHERLTRICFIDYDREMALVVERTREDGKPEIIGVGRLSKLHGRPEAEMAAMLQDELQGKGIGSELYRRLIEVARDQKLHKVHSNMLGENREMQALCRKMGFKLSTPDLEDNLVLAELPLT
jgi:acetyltransferase